MAKRKKKTYPKRYEAGALALGRRLRALRDARGLTQLQLALEVGIGPQTLRNWESGRRVPSLFVALALARALGVTLDSLAEQAQAQVHEPSDAAIILARRVAAAAARRLGVTLEDNEEPDVEDLAVRTIRGLAEQARALDLPAVADALLRQIGPAGG